MVCGRQVSKACNLTDKIFAGHILKFIECLNVEFKSEKSDHRLVWFDQGATVVCDPLRPTLPLGLVHLAYQEDPKRRLMRARCWSKACIVSNNLCALSAKN